MLFHRLGLGFSPSASNPDRRHCYVQPQALDQLLETPGVLALMAEELAASTEAASLSQLQLLEHIRRRAIHLAVTASPLRGLSVEEIVVITAYGSSRFDRTAWKQQLLRQPSERELTEACERWLAQRSAIISSGRRFGRHRWPLVGHAAPNDRSESPFAVAVAPFHSPLVLRAELELLASEADLAHEHYIACSPATALGFLALQANATRPPHWDSLVLDRRLRTLGIGLLLVEREGLLLYLPARFNALPVQARPAPGDP